MENILELTRTLNANFDIIKLITEIDKNTYTVLMILENHEAVSLNKLKSIGLVSAPYTLLGVSEVLRDTEKFQQVILKIFETVQEKEEYDKLQRDNNANDHRQLLETMQVLRFLPQHPGFVTLLPRGLQIYENIKKSIETICYIPDNYYMVRTPPMYVYDLWKKTGHAQKYHENMFIYDNMALKPMSCPAHALVFKDLHIHKLPFRIGEFGECFRNEAHGALQGLKRARFLTQDDGHIFCTRDQIVDEVDAFLRRARIFYKVYGFEHVKIVFSTRPEKFIGEVEDWNKVESQIIDYLNKTKQPFELAPGEGAFYGPKIELHISDIHGRYWQCGTIQIDWLLSKSLDVTVNINSQKQNCIVIHRATCGSIQRWLAVVVETQGGLPIVCNDLKVVAIVLSEELMKSKYVQELKQQLPITFDTDCDVNTSERTKKWISLRPNYLLYIGKNEIANNMVAIRQNNQTIKMPLSEFITKVQSEINVINTCSNI
jgi:threonyl-tRNA synthetase